MKTVVEIYLSRYKSAILFSFTSLLQTFSFKLVLEHILIERKLLKNVQIIGLQSQLVEFAT